MRSGKPSRGAALVSILVIALVFVLLGISVVAVETSQARYSTWKYNKAVTKQAAAAAIRKAEYQLSTQSSWNAGCIDISERKVEGSDCYYNVEVNECSKRFCTVTAHAYLKDPAGNRKWESKIKVTMKKNCFDFAALGACTGGTGKEPGITVKDDSVVEGDVGSFKPANTVAVEIGSSFTAASAASTTNADINNNAYTKPTTPVPTPTMSDALPANQNAGNQVNIGALSGKVNVGGGGGGGVNAANYKMSTVKPTATATVQNAVIQPMTGSIGVTTISPEGSQTPPQSSPGSSDSSSSANGTSSSGSSSSANGTSTSSSPGSSSPIISAPSTVPENATITINPNSPIGPQMPDPVPDAPAPDPIVSCDSSKISGNIFIYKDAVVSGNYQNSQLQIVGNDEVSSTHYTVPEGRDYQDITVQAGTQHRFTSGINTVKNFKAMEGSTIKIDATRGPVLIYIKESFSLNGAKFNVDGDPKNVIIYGAYDSIEKKGCTVSMTNSSKASFLFNGKYSKIDVSNSKFSGSLLSDRVEIKENSTVSFPASLVKMKSMPEILTWEEL